MFESNRHWIAYYLATTTPQRDPLRVTPVKRRSRVKWGPAASPSSASDRRRLLRWPRRVLSTNACGNKAEFGDNRINNRIRFIITIGAAMMRHRCLVERIRYVPQAEQYWQSIAEQKSNYGTQLMDGGGIQREGLRHGHGVWTSVMFSQGI